MGEAVIENERKKVSVIMGIYNCASTLDESIGSILNQSYSNWELIMCDDGSMDDTYQKALFYKKNMEIELFF